MKNFVRMSVASPEIFVGSPAKNIKSIIACYERSVANGSHLVLTPELSITGYTCGDVFGNNELLRQAEIALAELCGKIGETILVVGFPLLCKSRLFNTAIILQNEKILGIVPKQNLPDYREFYEKRQFRSGRESVGITDVELCGQRVPFGIDLTFCVRNAFQFGVEICEDLWSLEPPSVNLVKAGAEIILNPSASTEAVGKAEFRRDLVRLQSARLCAAYLYSGAGVGESTSDVVFGGHQIIAVNGRIIAENERFERVATESYADVNPKWLQTLRRSETSFNEAVVTKNFREILCDDFTIKNADGKYAKLSARPFVPAESDLLNRRCSEIFQIQVAGLAKRFQHTASKRLVIGLSGGLDSSLALLACFEMCKTLNLPASVILGITMPGFGTGSRTLNNVLKLSENLGIELRQISISDAVLQHFKDIGHEPENQNVVYENSQARERTQILMDIANGCNGIVVGTGDLSEIALGWSTFNGDQMSMYCVNSGIPKTLIKYIISNVAATSNVAMAEILNDVIATPVSPELLPGAQLTESIVGQYEIHDFYLYYFIKFGLGSDEMLELAKTLLSYPEEQLRDTLEIFMRRFVQQQFKRNSMPDGPKVGTISLSPRGDWRMPADGSFSL